MADRVGQQLDDYRLIRLLGAGTFGEVYLGEHIYHQRQVAVKVLKIQLTPDTLKEFLNEARTFRLKHPHIVPLSDFGIADDTPLLVMDYAAGGTLRQRHPQGTILPLESILAYVKQVAAALQYAHEARLIHRDVKPQNILLGRNQEVLLSDFGIAVIAHSERSLRTQEMAGTVPYMAPEQIQGKPQPASDQYALGIVVYEWLCGVRPFQGSQWQIISGHLSTPPPLLRQKVPAIPSVIEEVVLQALAKDPQQRFASVQAFATALEQANQIAGQFHATSPLSRSSSPALLGTPPHPLSMQSKVDSPSHRSSPTRDPILPPHQPSVHANVVAEQNQTVVPVRPAISPDQAPLSSLTPPLSRLPPVISSSQTFPPLSVASPSRQPTSYPVSPPHSQPAITNQRRGLSRSQASMLTGLVFMLVIGSAGLLYTPVNNYIAATHATATAYAQATITAAVRANAQATITAAVRAYNTATAKVVMDGFDPQHTHFNPYEKGLNPANVSHLGQYWTASTGSEIFSSPAVANGVVYVGSGDHKLYAFNASTGKPLWTASTGDIIGSSPAVANGVVYVGSEDHKLYAFHLLGTIP